MPRKYGVPYTGTITNAGGNTDLIEILPADDKPCGLVKFTIGQISEVADAAEEGLELAIIRMSATVTSGSGGSSVTPTLPDSADTAAGFTAEANNTTVATTSGTSTTLAYIHWNIRGSPQEFVFPEDDEMWKAKQGEGLFIRCNTTAADDITAAWTAIVKEY